MTWEDGQGGTTYSTTDMSPPASPWTGQRKHSPADRDRPAAPSAPHVHSASDLGMHHGQPTKPKQAGIHNLGFHVRLAVSLSSQAGLRGLMSSTLCIHSIVRRCRLTTNRRAIVGLLIPRPSSASKRRRLPRPPAPTNLRGPASLPRHLSARLVARYAGDGCTSESCQGFGPVYSMSAQGQQADEVGARGSHLKVPPRLLVRIEAPRDGLKLVPGHLW